MRPADRWSLLLLLLCLVFSPLLFDLSLALTAR